MSYVSEWTRPKVFLISISIRLALVAYSCIHDYLFKVPFTDIDYSVYHDGAMAVVRGGSPYERSTYRYSPMLAWLLIPNAINPHFGKILFCCTDILVGWLCIQLSDIIRRKRNMKNENDISLYYCTIFWLTNPLSLAISSRGNADSLIVAGVLCILLLIEKDKWYLAALIHGSIAIQLKIYPLILLPIVYLHSFHNQSSFPINKILSPRSGLSLSDRSRIFFHLRGHVYIIISLVSFCLTQLIFYSLYGDRFLHESLIHHFTRKDIRHNFSIYFYALYLCDDNEFLSKLISFGAFIPQLICIILFAVRYSSDLSFSSFLSIFSFVSLNKVCTSQYFIWYISLLPIIASSLEISHKESFILITIWFMGQGIWLLPAYLFEFQGYNSFEWIWIASILFLIINMYIMNRCCKLYRCSEKVKKID